MHLTRPLQLPVAQRDPEAAAFCGQVMASVRRSWQKRADSDLQLAPA